jgi:micrococcal nuclease
MKKIAALILVIALVVLANQFTGQLTSESHTKAVVERVIDGDTVVLEGGERVRLLGIDTPEKGQFLYQEASDWLRARTEGRVVVLEAGDEDRDKYGRMLRFLYSDGTLLNLELVRLGYASVYMSDPGERHHNQLLEAEASARMHGIGVWQHSSSDFCIGIHSFNYNAAGNDNENLNSEYVTFRNKCTEPVSVAGWVLKDSAGNTFTFPGVTVQNKSTITVRTGSGADSEADLFWGSDIAVWNNNGDTLLLWDSAGNLLLNHTYT